MIRRDPMRTLMIEFIGYERDSIMMNIKTKVKFDKSFITQYREWLSVNDAKALRDELDEVIKSMEKEAR